jgi:hypothetical protein
MSDLSKHEEEKPKEERCTCDEDRYCPPCFDDVKALHAARVSNENASILLGAIFGRKSNG